MPKRIRKSLRRCFSKMKISDKHIKFPIRRRKKPPSTAASDGRAKEDTSIAATLSDIDRFLFENFRSLYRPEGNGEGGEEETTSFEVGTPPPENLCSSARFFVPSGSSSSRIVKEAAGPSSSESGASAPDDFIAVLTYSPRPYEDFRRSMLEMVEARAGHNGKVDWGFMQELLFCYLDLNNKKSYKYILRAFVDLIVVLRENSGKTPAAAAAAPDEADRLKRMNDF